MGRYQHLLARLQTYKWPIEIYTSIYKTTINSIILLIQTQNTHLICFHALTHNFRSPLKFSFQGRGGGGRGFSFGERKNIILIKDLNKMSSSRRIPPIVQILGAIRMVLLLYLPWSLGRFRHASRGVPSLLCPSGIHTGEQQPCHIAEM